MNGGTPLARTLLAVLTAVAVSCGGETPAAPSGAPASIEEGRAVFRHETFGDERLWTEVLRMHEVIEDAVDPVTALSVGLKVDSEALPPGLLQSANLRDPATTVALLKLDAVVGLRGTVVSQGGRERLAAVGITCALCHSTVDDSVGPGIGRRVDGPANRSLNPGAIIALSPALTEQQKAIYRSWGPGRYDPRFNIDGKSAPVVIPPAYGLSGSPHATYTGDGDVKYWNRYVAVTQMGAQGNFIEPRLGIERRLPPGVADLVEPKLDALRDYQLSLRAPQPPPGRFDPAAAQRGRAAFERSCVGCHSGEARTSATLRQPAETGMDPTHANRSASRMYRATPLRGLWQHAPYFHDGSATSLAAVVDHYDRVRGLRLGPAEKADLIEYLKSL